MKTWEHTITVPGEGWVIVECGPMRLVIQAWRGPTPGTKEAISASKAAIGFLERVAALGKRLRQPAGRIQNTFPNDIAQRMFESAREIGDDDLTPMAAVAGTIADFVADRLIAEGMTRVVVDNGGDIAIRLAPGESVTVGLRPDVRSQAVSHEICLDGRMRSWGVATSGLGGRSLTRGIASAATVVARTASLADAAATAIANACNVDDPAIVRIPAEILDPNTDLPGVPVTVRVGNLPNLRWEEAVSKALDKANALCANQKILGAIVVAGEIGCMTEDMRRIVRSGYRSGNALTP